MTATTKTPIKDAIRQHHERNCSVIIAAHWRVLIIKWGEGKETKFHRSTSFKQFLDFLLEHPTATAWVLNDKTMKLEQLLGFVPWTEPSANEKEPHAPTPADTPAEPSLQVIELPKTKEKEVNKPKTPQKEAPATPPMKRQHNPPQRVRTSETLNEFIGPNGALTWPDVKKGLDGQFVPKASCANARVAILAMRIDCRYDLFHGRKLVGGQAVEQWAGELSDHACQILRVLIQKHFGFDPGRENVHDAAVQLCLQNPFDPVLDYLDSLTWDGKKRLDRWLVDYLGAEDTELNRVIGRLVLVAAIRRARQPGCKFDQIIVLEGIEGTQKSTAIAVMAGEENFSDQTILGLNEIRQMELIEGRWLYEIADLAGMRHSEVEAVKAFASRTADRGRPAYGRHVIDVPRRCVFFATTNDDAYLKSQTGNRRFWPVKTGRIAIEALRRDRDQLWAEAAQVEAAGEPIKLPERLWSQATAEQNKRLEHDPWDDLLDAVRGELHCGHDGDEERVASIVLITECLKIPPDRQTKEVEKKLAHCMRRLGWSGPKTQRVGGRLMRGYSRRVQQTKQATNSLPPWRK